MMTIRSLADARQLLPQVVEFELAASVDYANFVYGGIDEARVINAHLLSSGPCEFGEPHAAVALDGETAAGFVCGVPGAELTELRLRAATRLRDGGFAQLDPAVTARARLARTVMIKVQRSDVYLSRIAVAPVARGKGIGHHLMRHLLERAKALGAARCVLEVDPENPVAIGLYSRHGFVRVGSPSVVDTETGRRLAYDHMTLDLAQD